MKITPIAALFGAALMLSGCGFGALATIAPGEAIVAREVGYPSYFEQGLDYLAEQICADPARDPVTGDCK